MPKSPYRRHCLAPRCRLIASWGRSRSQGLGCSPIKAVRELGLERRETVNIALSVNSAKCWKLRMHPAVPPCHTRALRSDEDGGDNPTGGWSIVTAPDNQQERLDDYLAGYVDGRKLPSRSNGTRPHGSALATRSRVPRQPEPRASFDPRALASQTRLRPDPAQRQSWWSRQVARLRGTEPQRSSDGHPVLSSPPHPQREAPRVRDLRRDRDGDGEPGASLAGGFRRLLDLAVNMNGGGRYRRLDWSSRILGGHTPNTGIVPVKRWSDPHGDVGSQADRNDLAAGRQKPLGGNERVGPYPPWA